MFRILIFGAISLFISVKGSYDYPKPIIPFELPYNKMPLEDFEGQIVQEISTQDEQRRMPYSILHEDYFYVKRRKKTESGKIIVQLPDSTMDLEHQNLKISTLQDLTSLTPISTELNANIENPHFIQSSSVHNTVLSEQKSINEKPVLKSANDSTNYSQNTVSLTNLPVIFNHSPESHILNSQNVHNVDPDLLTLSITPMVQPLALNIENSNSNLLPVQNSATPVLNLLDSHTPVINVEATTFPVPTNGRNVLQTLFNVQHSDRTNRVQYNEQPLKTNYDSVTGNIPQEQTSGHLSSNLYNGKQKLFETEDNLHPLVHQSQFDSVYSYVSKVENKENIPKSVVTKHLYFHVPPPDIEELPVSRVPLPQKKIYKIVFIKLPSQESRIKGLRDVLYNNNQLVHNEDKTLIYVLVNNPEPPQFVLPQTKLSEHEVLFVKYKNNPSITSDDENGTSIKTISDDRDFALTSAAGRVNGNR